jgi:hypothetical protein
MFVIGRMGAKKYFPLEPTQLKKTDGTYKLIIINNLNRNPICNSGLNAWTPLFKGVLKIDRSLNWYVTCFFGEKRIAVLRYRVTWIGRHNLGS